LFTQIHLRSLTWLLFLAVSKVAYSNQIATLDVAISNNAVAAAKTTDGWQLLSFNGLTKNKDWRAVSNIAMGIDLTTKTSYQINNVPFSSGRLASIAATVNNMVYLFGGYTVSESHDEKSMADVYQYDPQLKNSPYLRKCSSLLMIQSP